MSTGKTKKEWLEQTLKPSLKKNPEREERFLTHSGIEVEPLYTPDDLQGFDYAQKLGYPGEYPFTRGVQSTMYRGRIWTMRQYA
ncbi:MAG: methylmalonyl-CoA mutase, partial [Chloroflexi bacterium]|nr:methylmalonyl-CoA mutase [Chloroflexota bacterium]